MDPTFIAIAIAIVLAVVGFLVYSRSKAKPEQIEAPPEERQLPKATQPEKAVKPVAKPATETTKPVKPSTAKPEKAAPAAKPSTPPVASTRAEPAEAPAVVAPPSVKAAVKPAVP